MAYSTPRAAFAGLGLLLRRPWVPVVWFLWSLPFGLCAAAILGGVLSGRFQPLEGLFEGRYGSIILLAAAVTTGLFGVSILDGAAMRSAKAGEPVGPAYMRLTIREASLLGLGPPRGVTWGPFPPVPLMAVNLFVLFGLYVMWRFDAPIALADKAKLTAGGWAVLFVANFFYVVRLSLARAADFFHFGADGLRSFRMTKGRFWSILTMQVLAHAQFALAALAVLYGAERLLGSDETAFWRPLTEAARALDFSSAAAFLGDPRAWILGGAVALIGVCRMVFLERASAVAYLDLREEMLERHEVLHAALA